MNEVPPDPDDAIARAIANAEEVSPDTVFPDRSKPRLLVEDAAPDRTVAALRDILAKAGGLYDHGLPVRLAYDQTQGTHVSTGTEVSPIVGFQNSLVGGFELVR